MRISLMAGALTACLCYCAAMAQPPLESDRDKTIYALGVALGGNVQPFALSEQELEIVQAGLLDGALGRELAVDMQIYGPQIQEMANEVMQESLAAEKKASGDYMYELAQQPGAERSTSGLVYIPVTAGTGPSPVETDSVRVHYHGTLRDGTVFDSSVERGEPVSFELTGVIPCWTEGLQRMRVGGKSKLACPSDLAYGDRGTGPIPGGAALLFEVELLGIE